MAKDTETYAHQEWLGYVQPVGLVVSIPALLSAQAYINKNIVPEHQRFLSCLPRDRHDEVIPEIRDFSEFTQTVLCWETEDLLGRSGGEPVPSSLEVALPEYHETLRPTYAVREFEPKDSENPWLMLIQELPTGTDLDTAIAEDSRHWHADPQSKFERLLRETQISIGLLFNGTHLRLVYAPRGETSGHMTFVVDEMATVAGRPIFAALHTLLSAERLFSLLETQRLPAILANSRKYQNVVSTKLAEQVLAALYELLRGFQAADDQRKGELLRDVLAEAPNHVYAGLLTVLMRLVFVLYAEDRDLLSSDPVYTNYYSVTGLFERLRADAGRFPDTMDQRYGAWAQLLTLFRLIYEGGSHGEFHIPARKGYLFDPDRYNFLEGRHWKTPRDEADSVDVPRVSDGVVYRALNNLLILDGERLSYRALDVEQIGSVYETIMGFDLQVAQGRSIAIKPTKSHGAPTTINLEELLETEPAMRAKWVRERTDQDLTGQAASVLKNADSIEDLLAALEKKIARIVTPNVVSNRAMVLQPSDERRRSGSHYTPRSLTKPIVETTLEPIIKQLVEPSKDEKPMLNSKVRKTQDQVRKLERDEEAAQLAREKGSPHPRQILNLKICDPAMGSGAFLVETCRQLGDELVKAWYAHDCVPTGDIPSDEDEVLYARRLIAQRCLYGVDKNPIAVDLSKLSLWLATLAKDHSFTFLDHSLRHGDSLVGLTRSQIIGFHWAPKKQKQFGEDLIQKRLDRATKARAQILNAREDVPYRDQEERLAVADEALNVVRMTGDACVSAFFAGSKLKEREDRCEELFAQISDWYASGHDINKRDPIAEAVAELQRGEHPLTPFHWEIEYPEVFARENDGFDAFVGNPPFMGGSKISSALGSSYLDILYLLLPGQHGRSDLVAYFFRQAFALLNNGGTLGLIGTNTISQGDSRSFGLAQICIGGGTIYSAQSRYRWPGAAAVIVSVIHIRKGAGTGFASLNGHRVYRITPFLVPAGPITEPHRLVANRGLSFKGAFLLGNGFIFDDEDPKGSPLAEMNKILDTHPEYSPFVKPYIGGKEVNISPTHAPHRYTIDFGELTEDEAREMPELFTIVESKVRPERIGKPGSYSSDWWLFGRRSRAFKSRSKSLKHITAISRIGGHCLFVLLPADMVHSESLIVFPIEDIRFLSVLQSRVHEIWARFFCSTMKDDLRYTPSDGFETFPFPENWQIDSALKTAGKKYYEFRAHLLVQRNEGLTTTYNHFHDPHEKSSEIAHLRELQEAMDQAVLEAYGWDDLAQGARCEFLLDYEEEDDENESGQKSKKKKPWRLRWPDEFRDEVLARLLALNQERAEQEHLSGVAVEAASAKSAKRGKSGQASMKATKKRSRKQPNEPESPGLFSNIETAEKTARG